MSLTALLALAALAPVAAQAPAVAGDRPPAPATAPLETSESLRIDADAPVRILGKSDADAYVEARLRRLPTGGADGRAYVVGRYQDADNWYGAGLGWQEAKGRMQIEIVRMQDGRLTRLKQFNRAAATDARFYTVRLEMAGNSLTAYLDGERITSVIDGGLAQAGGYGVVAQGAPFEISVPVTGAATDKPARLALARAPQRVQLSVGDAPVSLAVSALGPYRIVAAADAGSNASGNGTASAKTSLAVSGYLTPSALQDAAMSAPANGAQTIRFMASVAQPALVTATVADGALVLAPRAAGVTTVTLASPDSPNVQSVLEVRVAAASPARRSAIKLAGAVLPAIGERDVPFDTPLRLRFDQAPVLGESGGAIRVYRVRDGALVDTVRTGSESDLLGYAGQPLRRAVRWQPVAIEGRDAVIDRHPVLLVRRQSGIVQVDDGVLAGAIGGTAFTGVTMAQGWTFHTRAALPPGAQALVVDDDGAADFRTVQGALNYAMQHTARTAPVTVTIRAGRYQELLYLRGKDNLTLRGQSRDGTVIDAVNSDGVNPGSGTAQEARAPGITGGRAVFLIEDADLVTIDGLTLRNSALRASPTGGQAEALFFNSEGRLIVKNASLFSEQDTVQVRGYSWFYRSLIAGNVDYIWGNNRAALFEDSELRTVGDSGNGKSGGYLLQARTVSAQDKGFMFVNSRLTHGLGPTGNDVPAGATWLARSPGYAATWDHVAFINCRMGPHIAPVGWAGPNVTQPAPNPGQATATAGWREYGSMDLAGKPLDTSARQFGRVLDAQEAKAAYTTRAEFFAGFGGGRGWRPE